MLSFRISLFLPSSLTPFAFLPHLPSLSFILIRNIAMTEYPLTLFCLVEGQCPSRAFPVCIPPSKTVGELKKYIKAEQSPNFDDIAANNLTLWRATIYNNDGNMTCAVTMGSLGSKTELNNPRTPLSEIFPESQSLDDNTYIFVQRSREGIYSQAVNIFFSALQSKISYFFIPRILNPLRRFFYIYFAPT